MLTSRQEAYCRFLAEGHSQYEAYRQAGYGSKGRNATDAHAARLARNGKVKNRLNELKGEAAKRTEKTVASLVAQLDEVVVFARQCNNPSAMVAAVALQARLLGLEAPRQVEVAHKPAPLPTRMLELSEEEWVAQFSTPLRLSRPGKTPKPLRQIPDESSIKTVAAQETGAKLPAMTAAPTWEPRVIYLDDEP